jgi:mono/diheme cytochrome c family protein
MRKNPTLFTLLIAIWLVAFLAACAGSPQPTVVSDQAKPTVPPDYAGKSNPLAGDAAAIEAGKQLYAANCAACHGASGMGDGPAAQSLNPKPQPLAKEMSALQDDYILWRIAEGGAMSPFHSAMPAWKMIFSQEQIWQVMAFLRTLK